MEVEEVVEVEEEAEEEDSVKQAEFKIEMQKEIIVNNNGNQGINCF